MIRYIEIAGIILCLAACVHRKPPALPCGLPPDDRPFPCSSEEYRKGQEQLAGEVIEACRLACEGEFEKAIEVLHIDEEILRQDPIIRWLRADIFFLDGRYEKALRELNEAAMNGASGRAFRRDAERIRESIASAWTDGADKAESRGDIYTAFRLIHLFNTYFEATETSVEREMKWALEIGNPDAVMAAAERLPDVGSGRIDEMIGDAWMKKGDTAKAALYYGRAMKRVFDTALRDKFDAARNAYTADCIGSRLPDVKDAPWVNRGELAALLTCIIPELQDAPWPPSVIRDIDGHWAEEDIKDIIALDILSLDRNHCFHPKARVKRLDLAVACARILELSGIDVTLPDIWSVLPDDVSPAHFAARDICLCLRYNILKLSDDGRFQGALNPSGATVMNALFRLDETLRSLAFKPPADPR